MTRRELCAHGVLFAFAYVGFLGHFRSEHPAAGNASTVFSASQFISPVAAGAPHASTSFASRVRATVAPASSQRNSVQIRAVDDLTQTQDQSPYEPGPVQDDSQSQLAAFAAQMSDPDPEVARVARDAYMAVLEGR